MKSCLVGAVCTIMFTFITLSANAALIGVLPATSGGTDWQAGYDNDRDISWIANANLAVTMDFGVSAINGNGTMIWDTANEWIAAMNTANYLGFNDWRLPITPQPDSSCDQIDFGTGVGFGTRCTGSEMGHLANVEGVNSDGGPAAVVLGIFTNVQTIPYWSSTEFAPDPTDAWTLSFNGGDQRIGGKGSFNSVWAMRDGDVSVSAVPVPAAIWLFGSGLLGLIGMTRRKKTA